MSFKDIRGVYFLKSDETNEFDQNALAPYYGEHLNIESLREVLMEQGYQALFRGNCISGNSAVYFDDNGQKKVLGKVLQKDESILDRIIEKVIGDEKNARI